MKIEDLLKDKPDTLREVRDAIKEANSKIEDSSKKIHFVDLGEGGYVENKAYTALETKYNDLKNAENPFEKKYNDLLESSKKDLGAERDKLSGIAKKLAVDNAVGKLGIENELALAGIKSLIRYDEIKLDDDYSIKDGLQSQIDSIKENYKSAFETKVVSTGNVVKDSLKNAGTEKRYSSLDEIRAMTPEQIQADYNNIIGQLGNLK